MSKGELLLSRRREIYMGGFSVIKKNFLLDEDLSFLHVEELKYYKSLEYNNRKNSYLLGRFSAKEAISNVFLLGAFNSTWIKFGVFKYPVIKNSLLENIQVCISHCDNIGIALAFPEEHPLGIDIERIDPNMIITLKSQITNDELKLEHNLSILTKYTVIWTIKESLSKILKTGLTLDFKILKLKSLKKEGSTYESTFSNYSQYKGISYLFDDYVCTVVLPRKTYVDMNPFWNALNKEIEKK